MAKGDTTPAWVTRVLLHTIQSPKIAGMTCEDMSHGDGSVSRALAEKFAYVETRNMSAPSPEDAAGVLSFVRSGKPDWVVARVRKESAVATTRAAFAKSPRGVAILSDVDAFLTDAFYTAFLKSTPPDVMLHVSGACPTRGSLVWAIWYLDETHTGTQTIFAPKCSEAMSQPHDGATRVDTTC